MVKKFVISLPDNLAIMVLEHKKKGLSASVQVRLALGKFFREAEYE